MRIAILTATLLAALVLAPAAQAGPRQVMTFEAPDELLDDSRRDATLDEIRGFGVTQIRQLVYWQQFAPGSNRKTKPQFNASDPNAYPALGLVDRLISAASARGIKVILTPTGPVPRWATKSKKGNLNRPSARQFGQFVTALARRYGSQVDTWSVWNEPNQPQFLMPQYRKKRAGLTRDLPQPLPRRLRRDPQRAGEPARHDPDRRDVPARQRERRAPAHLPARGHVPELEVQEDALVLAAPRRRLRPPRLHDADRAALRAVRQERRHDRGARPPRDRARPRRPRARAAARLKIYLTEFGIQSEPDRISGVSFERQHAYYAIAEHMAYVNSRVALFSQYLMRDDAPREEGYRFRGFESGLMRNNGQRKPAYRAFPNPLAVERYGPSDVLWGLIRPQPGVTRVTIEVAAVRPAELERPAAPQHHLARRLRPAGAPSQGPAVPRAVDLQRRQGLHRAGHPGVQVGVLTR